MKQYSLNNFLDSSFGMFRFSKQKSMSQLFVQIKDCASDMVVRRGEEIGKILIYKSANDKECIKEIYIVAPIDGYYFIEPYYALERIQNINISQNIIKCYECIGEDIADENEHFVNSYNELLSALRNYYEDFITTSEIRRTYSYLGKCDYSIGFPETDEPVDFLSLVDEFLRGRQYLSEKDVIRRCQTITQFVRNSLSVYPPVMVFISSRSIVLNNEVFKFKDIVEINKNGDVKSHRRKTIACVHDAISKLIIRNIINANYKEDYSKICDEEALSSVKKLYSANDLLSAEDRSLVKKCKWKFQIANEFDIAFPDMAINAINILEHYYEADDIIVELSNQEGTKIQVRTKNAGYYSFSIPSFYDSIFFDIPFIEYTPKEEYYNAVKDIIYVDLYPHKYVIEQDRFSKEKSIKWSNLDSIQILPDIWYEFRVSFNYTNNEPTIVLGFKNVYSKRTIKDKYKYVDGKSYSFSMLLTNGQSLDYSKKNYRETYIGEEGYYIWVEYSLTKQEINTFLHNAIEAVRIYTPEGETFEYDAEPFFYDNFKKYVKVYYDAIVKCDATFKCDISDSTKMTESCFVYLMHDLANDYYKIGISNSPEYRERTLQSEKPTIELVIAKEFPVRRIAEAYEAALHKTYEAKRLRGEWFRLESDDVENLRKALS